MAEFGVRRGLAQSFGFDQRVADLARQQDQMRQAKIYAENKAKMLAEDFDYNNAINAWDNTAIKDYAQGKIKELGAFVRENPDYLYNVEKRIAYNNLKRELKDSKPLLEGLQVDSNIKAMDAYKNDPKNAPMLDTPEFQQKMQEYQNYIKTGSADGVTANRKLFTFQPPEERVDTWGELAKIAQATEYDAESDSYMRGVRTRKQYVSDAAKLRRAQFALTDQKLSRTLQQEYNKYLSNEVPEGQKPLPIDRYVYDKMKDWFPASKYNDTHYQVKEDREPRDSDGSRTANDLGLYTNIVDVSTLNPGRPIAANPKGARALIAGDDPSVDLGGGFFKTPEGTYVPMNNLITSNFRTNKSEVIYDPKTKQHYMSADVSLNEDAAEDAFKTIKPVDTPFVHWFWLDDTNIDPEYKDQISLQGKDVNFKVYFPIQTGSAGVSSAAAYNHGAGQTLEKSNTDQPTQVYSRSQLKSKGYTDAQIDDFKNNYNATVTED
ncbi:MAG: hypothetical protein RIR01_1907 [Bacteroidota bacterium]|jgi:hypothetical protein